MNKRNYPKNWKTKIRRDILIRDHYTCQHCQARQYAIGKYLPNGRFTEVQAPPVGFSPFTNYQEDYHRRYRNLAFSNLSTLKAKDPLSFRRLQVVILAVAHLDQDTRNNSDDNLLTYCQRCHFAYDRSFNVPKLLFNRKYGKHWRKDQLFFPFK